MSAPFRDEAAGLEARAREARRELAELRSTIERARARYRAAHEALEHRLATQAPAPQPLVTPATLKDTRSFWVGLLMGGLLGLLLWFPMIKARAGH